MSDVRSKVLEICQRQIHRLAQTDPSLFSDDDLLFLAKMVRADSMGRLSAGDLGVSSDKEEVEIDLGDTKAVLRDVVLAQVDNIHSLGDAVTMEMLRFVDTMLRVYKDPAERSQHFTDDATEDDLLLALYGDDDDAGS